VGASCIGAKVNHKLVPLSYKLQNGDQVEIITSSKQVPKEDWLSFVVTAKAKAKIKSALKEERRKIAEDGKEILERKMKSLKITYNSENLLKISYYFKLTSTQDLFFNVAKGVIDMKDLKDYQASEKVIENKPQDKIEQEQVQSLLRNIKAKDSDMLLIGEDMQKIDYKLANCCNPIPGDDVFGFVTVSDGIKIHRTNCPNAAKLMANYGYRIVKARWTNQQELAFLTGIRITGIDDVGLINQITTVISNDFKVNMRSITVDSDNGIFEGSIMVYVNDTEHLDNLIKKLRMVKGVTAVTRFDSDIEKAS
jgi:GTP diphosphokinase / guanosine-3',5'-bis(diphosphate) 3'-diphosphatase